MRTYLLDKQHQTLDVLKHFSGNNKYFNILTNLQHSENYSVNTRAN